MEKTNILLSVLLLFDASDDQLSFATCLDIVHATIHLREYYVPVAREPLVPYDHTRSSLMPVLELSEVS